MAGDSGNLPALPSPTQVSREMGTLPVAQRSEARQQALSYSRGWINLLDDIARDEDQKGATRVSAMKAGLAVAALLSSTNIPRDVVKEKWELTVDVIRDLLPPELWAEFAERVRPIWNDL